MVKGESELKTPTHKGDGTPAKHWCIDIEH